MIGQQVAVHRRLCPLAADSNFPLHTVERSVEDSPEERARDRRAAPLIGYRRYSCTRQGPGDPSVPICVDLWIVPHARLRPAPPSGILRSMFLARVYVTLKPTVNDPQGLTVRGGLHALGFASVVSVRAGKYMEIRLDAPDRAAAEAQVTEMCRKLLANPVIEDFRFELDEAPVAAG